MYNTKDVAKVMQAWSSQDLDLVLGEPRAPRTSKEALELPEANQEEQVRAVRGEEVKTAAVMTMPSLGLGG